ncbi:MAG: hypothetical protein ACI8Y4_005020, partial [Candidatus Poriferisodalaceae bacterium]
MPSGWLKDLHLRAHSVSRHAPLMASTASRSMRSFTTTTPLFSKMLTT